MTSSKGGASAPRGSCEDVRLERGEVLVLSPDAVRFKERFRRVRPQSAHELRELIGLSESMTEVIQAQGVCCHAGEVSASVPSPTELEAEDDTVSGEAREVVAAALLTYLRTSTPAQLKPMEPVMDRYLELSGLVANVVALADIHVADGATLRIADDTHLVEANKVVLQGTGTIECNGFTKLRVDSIEQT